MSTYYWSLASPSASCGFAWSAASSTQDCVTDGSGNYADSERCDYVAQYDMTLTVPSYNTESAYDYFTLITPGGSQTSFSGTDPGGITIAAGDTLRWESDVNNNYQGYTVCGTPVVACSGSNCPPSPSPPSGSGYCSGFNCPPSPSPPPPQPPGVRRRRHRATERWC